MEMEKKCEKWAVGMVVIQAMYNVHVHRAYIIVDG